MPAERTLDDSLSIQMVFQRLYMASVKITLAHREKRGDFQIISMENNRLAANIDKVAFEGWKLVPGEKVAVNLEDRGFKYEAVVDCQGTEDVEGLPCACISMPRTLRRSDSHRLADFAPDSAISCTFSNSRSSLIDAQVKGFGLDGLELALRDPRQKIQEALRMGEESTIEVPLEGNLKILAPTRVAYFGDTYVGLKFTEKADKALLGQYRSWLENQQRVQALRDKESYEADAGRKPVPRGKGADLPPVRLWVERDPMILVITEKEDFARRMAEGMGRKFGVLSLDYIKGKVRPMLSAWGGDEETWGRVRLVVVHNHLRLVSPLELTRQLVEQEQCPLPVLAAGSAEDMELKRNRAVAAGAVDYLPVDPFQILHVLRKLDDTIRMFEG